MIILMKGENHNSYDGEIMINLMKEEIMIILVGVRGIISFIYDSSLNMQL